MRGWMLLAVFAMSLESGYDSVSLSKTDSW